MEARLGQAHLKLQNISFMPLLTYKLWISYKSVVISRSFVIPN